MKSILLLLGISVSFLLGESKLDFYEVVGISKNDTLSLKSQPKVNSKKIGELSFNTTGIKVLECIKTKDAKYREWCQVILSEDDTIKIKWVAKKFLKKSLSNKLKKSDKYKGQTYRVIRHKANEFLNVRAGVNTQYKIIDMLSHDKMGIEISNCFNVNNKNNSRWCWINYQDDNNINKKGWVSAKYLQNENKRKSNVKQIEDSSVPPSIKDEDIKVANGRFEAMIKDMKSCEGYGSQAESKQIVEDAIKGLSLIQTAIMAKWIEDYSDSLANIFDQCEPRYMEHKIKRLNQGLAPIKKLNRDLQRLENPY